MMLKKIVILNILTIYAIFSQDITGKWTTSYKSEDILAAIYEIKMSPDGKISGVTYGNPDPFTEFRITITGYYDKKTKTYIFREDKYIVKRSRNQICRGAYRLKLKVLPNGEQYLEGTHTDIDCGLGTGIIKLYRYVPPKPKPKPKQKPKPAPPPPKPKPKPKPKPTPTPPKPKPKQKITSTLPPKPKPEPKPTPPPPETETKFECNETEIITVYFNEFSEKVPERFHKQLDDIARFMKECKKIHIELIGYSEKGPYKGYELRIARDRAVRVKQYLVSKGIEPHRIHIKKWYDSSQQDMTENPRRVEMIIKPKNT